MGATHVNGPETWGGRILLAGVAVGVFVCIDLENGGPRNADAFETQSEVKTKQDQSKETISFKGQIRDSGWLSIKFDGSVVDLNPMRADSSRRTASRRSNLSRKRAR